MRLCHHSVSNAFCSRRYFFIFVFFIIRVIVNPANIRVYHPTALGLKNNNVILNEKLSSTQL